MKQTITIHTDGAMTGLQMKPGKGVDLRGFGKAEIKRVSEIAWDEHNQSWLVQPLAPQCLAHLREDGRGLFAWIWTRVCHKAIPMPCRMADDGFLTLLFDDYDDAVAAEIEFYNAARKVWPEELREFTGQ